MSKRTRIDWYFDYVSPFAYLQLEQFHRLPDTLDIRYHPVLLAGLLGYWESKGPAEIPAKRQYTYQYVQWLSKRLNTPLRFPNAHPFNPLTLLRLTTALGNNSKTVIQLFRYIWADGHLPNETDHWQQLINDLGVHDADSLIQQDSVKSELRDATQRAAEAGVFGVPTFIVNGELFWGLDALDFLTEYLDNPQVRDSEEMRRLASLPVAATR